MECRTARHFNSRTTLLKALLLLKASRHRRRLPLPSTVHSSSCEAKNCGLVIPPAPYAGTRVFVRKMRHIAQISVFGVLLLISSSPDRTEVRLFCSHLSSRPVSQTKRVGVTVRRTSVVILLFDKSLQTIRAGIPVHRTSWSPFSAERGAT